MKTMRNSLFLLPLKRLIVALSLLLTLSPVALIAGSRIIGTGGINSIEGVAGGGITPWAVISGYSSSDEWSATINYSKVSLDDFQLNATTASISYSNRVELSFAKQILAVDPLSSEIGQDIISAKVRVYGDIIYSDMPQLSFGLIHKKNNGFAIPQLLGALEDSGTDYYFSASKLFLHGPGGYNWLVNGSARYSNANQTGLLGFGGIGDSGKRWQAEGSIVFLPTESLAIGIEYRQHPDNLSVKQSDWKDIFVAWFVNENFSVSAAYVDLGLVAGLGDQKGYYVNLQGYL